MDRYDGSSGRNSRTADSQPSRLASSVCSARRSDILMTDAPPPHTDDHHPPPGARQTQFLNVISRDEAERRFQERLPITPPGCETIPLSSSVGRVLSEDVLSTVDVPSFDRSNVDGFAVCAADTTTASETTPRQMRLNTKVLSPGIQPTSPLNRGTATTIATGSMIPRGADAVLMVEHTDVDSTGRLQIQRPVAAGENVTFAGTDIARGETVLHGGQLLTSRELGVLAAIGQDTVSVFRQPRVAILSTGDEIVPPGRPLPVGSVYDSNAAILAAAVAECGGMPVPMGVVPDDETELRTALTAAMQHDIVLLSGGTSKGAGDLSYRIVGRLGQPGIVAHGVALKPGKPICLAVCDDKPVVILPGFPTSAIFTFHEFVAPVIRRLAGRSHESRQTTSAMLPMRINSQRGRTEYVLVSLFQRADGTLAAYPLGQGSGSVTTFSRAEGFITIDQQTEIVEAGADVAVTLLDQHLRPADLTVITSHCIGLDRLLSHVQRQGFTVKLMTVGSTGSLAAVKRGECDVAGVHLLDATSGEYNRPFLSDDVELVPGYGRMQCLVHRPDDPRFNTATVEESIRNAAVFDDCRMVNRNAGSGTRILIDRLLQDAGVEEQPAGYGVQVRSHNAVCAAIAQGRADWGVAIDTVAALYDLAAVPISEESFDFVIPRSRRRRPAVEAFVNVLTDASVREELREIGFR